MDRKDPESKTDTHTPACMRTHTLTHKDMGIKWSGNEVR